MMDSLNFSKCTKKVQKQGFPRIFCFPFWSVVFKAACIMLFGVGSYLIQTVVRVKTLYPNDLYIC